MRPRNCDSSSLRHHIPQMWSGIWLCVQDLIPELNSYTTVCSKENRKNETTHKPTKEAIKSKHLTYSKISPPWTVRMTLTPPFAHLVLLSCRIEPPACCMYHSTFMWSFLLRCCCATFWPCEKNQWQKWSANQPSVMSVMVKSMGEDKDESIPCCPTAGSLTTEQKTIHASSQTDRWCCLEGEGAEICFMTLLL